MITVVNIPAIFQTLVNRVSVELHKSSNTNPFPVYFDYGRKAEVTRNLIRKDGGITTGDKKYPLLWVVVPYTVKETFVGAIAEITDMQIIIATVTIPDSTSPERIEKNFVPYLYPIYSEFKRQIDKSGFFHDIDYDNLHNRIDLPYWGGQDGQDDKNLFGDYIDAILLKNIHLKITEETCSQFNLIRGTAAINN